MWEIWEKNKNLKIGDLVYHILYGRRWLGVVIDFEKTEKGLSKDKSRVLVHMVPGTEYCSHFEKAFSIKDSQGRGWVTINWLVKVNLKK